MPSNKGWRRVLTALTAAAVGTAMLFLANPASGQAAVTLSSKIGGVPAAGSSESHSVSLSSGPTDIDLLVTNRGTAPIVARTFRLSSSVLGFNVFSYETAVQVRVAPGDTQERRFRLDLSGLKGQTSGLLPASITLLDANRHPLVVQDATVDVHAPKLSVYGIFGLILLLLTALALVQAVLALARNRLPPNRWSRGVMFLVPGIGLGLALVIGFSVFAMFAPRVNRWGPILLVTGLALFAFGYFTPTPENALNRRPDEEPGEQEMATVARSG